VPGFFVAKERVMGKGLRNTFISLAIIVLLLIAIPFLIPTDSIRQAVEKEASGASGMDVRIESLSLRFLPEPGLDLTNLVVEDVVGGTAKAIIASGKLSVALGPLMEEQVQLQGIHFKDIDLRVSEKAKGKAVHVVHIDSVLGSVNLTADKLEMPNWKVQLYDGSVQLSATLSPLDGKKRTLSAKLKGEGIQIQPLLKDASGKATFSGLFSTDLKVTASGATEKSMQRSLRVDGPVSMKAGEITGIGMEGTAVALVHGKLAGGPIVYDEMKFQLKVRGRDKWLNNIALTSSHLDAKGKVKIAASKKLDGEIITSGMAGISGATLLVGGTTDSPLILPAASSLIGGVIGASVGGPAGAAIGAKAGSKAGEVLEGIGGAVKSIFGK